MSNRYVVVLLDDAKYGAGPGTVINTGESIQSLLDEQRDRDGAIDARIRIWVGPGSIGERVVAANLSMEGKNAA